MISLTAEAAEAMEILPRRHCLHPPVLDGGSEGPFVPLSTSVAGEMDTSPSLSMAFVVIV